MGDPVSGDLEAKFRQARDDPSIAILEGFHALKHALRFNADLIGAFSPDVDALIKLAATLAPDLTEILRSETKSVDRRLFRQILGPRRSADVISLAHRPTCSVEEVLGRKSIGPVVFLENPRNLGNVGAVVRVAAAAGACAVLTSGLRDPWDPAAIRGSAGLHFAIDVVSASHHDLRGRTVVAVDPAGSPLGDWTADPTAVYAFGTERHGLSHELLQRADQCVSIPMRPGVSSLNLATAVAVMLYSKLR